MYLDYLKKTIRINLVYYGIPFAGKSTTIRKILECTSASSDAIQPIYFYSLDTERVISGEYIPKQRNSSPFQWIFQLMAFPGYSGYVYDKAHKILLSKADGIVFVVDSQKTRMKENDAYFEVLRRRIKELHGQNLLQFPFILQWNKEDMESSMAAERSSISSKVPESQIYKTCAIEGKGIIESMNHCISMIIKRLHIL